VGGGAGPPPSCFDPACVTSGYKEISQGPGINGEPCPNYIDCRQIINASDSVLNNVNVQQHCGAEIKQYKSQADANTAAQIDKIIDNKKVSLGIPGWKVKYDRVTDSGIGKKYADLVNSIIPDTEFGDTTKVGGVPLNQIKPLIFLFVLILCVLILYSNNSIPSITGGRVMWYATAIR
jgi:hypothetical protein